MFVDTCFEDNALVKTATFTWVSELHAEEATWGHE